MDSLVPAALISDEQVDFHALVLQWATLMFRSFTLDMHHCSNIIFLGAGRQKQYGGEEDAGPEVRS